MYIAYKYVHIYIQLYVRMCLCKHPKGLYSCIKICTLYIHDYIGSVLVERIDE